MNPRDDVDAHRGWAQTAVAVRRGARARASGPRWCPASPNLVGSSITSSAAPSPRSSWPGWTASRIRIWKPRLSSNSRTPTAVERGCAGIGVGRTDLFDLVGVASRDGLGDPAIGPDSPQVATAARDGSPMSSSPRSAPGRSEVTSHPERGRRRVRRRPGPPRPRQDPPLHAPDRHRRARHRADVRTRRVAGRLRPSARRPGRDPVLDRSPA